MITDDPLTIWSMIQFLSGIGASLFWVIFILEIAPGRGIRSARRHLAILSATLIGFLLLSGLFGLLALASPCDLFQGLPC